MAPYKRGGVWWFEFVFNGERVGESTKQGNKRVAEQIESARRVRALLKMPSDFVPHSLRHTFGTRLGESGADAFIIMKLMGHSTVTVSQRYVHPSPAAIELAYERMTAMNLRRLPTNSPTVNQGHVAIT
jgi:integrase